MAGQFRFTFGPWNIHEGADPFGPEVRKTVRFNKKLEAYKQNGFDGVQFHDDDAVPDLDALKPDQIERQARALRKTLDKHGLAAEFVAPRLWFDPRTIDGGYTSNNAAQRRYAIDRSKQAIDIANVLGTDLIVLWLAREGTYIREAKDSKLAVERLVAAINEMLAHDPRIRIAVEPKPNEPMDIAFIPTTGHAVALAHMTDDPSRVGVVIESAHAILAGLDPSDEMGFALANDKLWTVHLNDQNGLKFDQDKTFGSVDLRRALNQVRILDKHDYGRRGEWVGLDVKAMRTQKDKVALKHLTNSRRVFLRLLEISRKLDDNKIAAMIGERDYEELEMYILSALMGK
ncbi:MAG TPA: TIM barrel protein [Candidatus Sumerlaeota bacterium]|nr:MAG: Xylose isomerase [candidate division BRC1 bacterium ADurb.BinA292]HOE97304.1 TIM barrel protein [Candidatus Sumerlaeota bacterium]